MIGSHNRQRDISRAARPPPPPAPKATRYETRGTDKHGSIGVRGENTIIKKVVVSSSFGYLIMDSVVAPHDKIDVSRQLFKTLQFTLKNVH